MSHPPHPAIAVRRFAATGLAALAMMTAAVPAAAGSGRVALVVGESAYQHGPTVPTAAEDARALATALEGLGFEAELAIDQDKAGLERAIRRLAGRSEGAEIALFFFAGHGLQVDGVNYLLPVDAHLEHIWDVSFEAVDAGLPLRVMAPATRAKLAILDASREHGLLPTPSGAGTRMAIDEGLAAMETALPRDALVALSSAPDTTAFDAPDGRSAFTAALIRTIAEPGLEIRQVLSRVRQTVAEETGGLQKPWDNSSLTADVFLAGSAAAGAPPIAKASAAAVTQAEVLFWQSVMTSAQVEDFADYLSQFPGGTFSGLANRRVAELRSGQVADLSRGLTGAGTASPPAAPLRAVPGL